MFNFLAPQFTSSFQAPALSAATLPQAQAQFRPPPPLPNFLAGVFGGGPVAPQVQAPQLNPNLPTIGSGPFAFNPLQWALAQQGPQQQPQQQPQVQRPQAVNPNVGIPGGAGRPLAFGFTPQGHGNLGEFLRNQAVKRGFGAR